MNATITLPAAPYADYDDSLTAAADEYAAEHGLVGWDLAPRWGDDERDTILIDVPDREVRLAARAATDYLADAEGCLVRMRRWADRAPGDEYRHAEFLVRRAEWNVERARAQLRYAIAGRVVFASEAVR